MKAGFRDTIVAKRTGGHDGDGRALWRVFEPLLYWSDLLQCWLIVPAGFVTNYASVPRLPIVYAWCGDRVYEPPAGHDLAYTLHAVLVATVDEQFRVLATQLEPVTRKDADDLFLESLLTQPEAVDEATAHAMYAGVRLGGESSWRADTTVQQPDFINRMILPVDVHTEVEQRDREAA